MKLNIKDSIVLSIIVLFAVCVGCYLSPRAMEFFKQIAI